MFSGQSLTSSLNNIPFNTAKPARPAEKILSTSMVAKLMWNELWSLLSPVTIVGEGKVYYVKTTRNNRLV